MKYPINQLHQYVRILLGGRIEEPFRILGLRRRTVYIFYGLAQFLRRNHKMRYLTMGVRIGCAKKEMSVYPAPRIVHRKSVQWTDVEKILLFPLLQHGQDLHQIGDRSRPLMAMTGGIILPVEIPHGVAPILERLHPPHNAGGHDTNHGQSGMS